MDETRLFTWLEKQKKAVLLALLRRAFERLDTQARWDVFGKAFRDAPEVPVKGEELLAEIQTFHAESCAGKYWRELVKGLDGWYETPEVTLAWFDRLGDHFQASTQLSKEGAHAAAVACFAPLYDLLDADTMCNAVNAEEIGDWMLPGDTKVYLAAYLASHSAVSTPEQYAEAVVPLIRRDLNYRSDDNVRAAALRAATPKQRRRLEVELRELGIESEDR